MREREPGSAAGFGGVLAVIVLLALAGCASRPAVVPPAAVAAPDPKGAFAITDPLLATVVGTPKEQMPVLPERVPSRAERLPRVDSARIPSVFFDENEIRYSIATQRGPAPLVFVIAGTGARYSAERMQFLEGLLYGNGCHVVSLSSPTHPDFILTSSEHHVPGYMRQDVEDLYALMGRIRAAHSELEVSSFQLVGYSLGATEAAFLAKHDASERAFNFDRVLLINPSVSLYESSRIFDSMFTHALPEGPTGVDTMIGELFARVTPYVHNQARGKLDNDFLFHIADQGELSEQELRAAIATVFRLSLANMVFTVDVSTGGGHVVEAQRKLTVATSLTDSFKRSTRWDFDRYVDDLLLPYWQQRRPDLDRDDLIADASLVSIAGWLARAQHVGVITNADDIILAPGQLDFLRRTFGKRAVVYPHGGHLGNMQHHDFAASILAWLGTPKGGDA